MKRLSIVFIGILILLVFSGCFFEKATEELNKEKEVRVATSNVTDGEEIPILTEDFLLTPKEGWTIKVTKGPIAEFIIKNEDRDNIVTIKYHERFEGQPVKIYDELFTYKDDLGTALDNFKQIRADASTPEKIIIDIDGLSTDGYYMTFTHNKTGKTVYLLIFTCVMNNKLIELTFTSNEDDYYLLKDDVLEVFSTLSTR